MNCTYNEILDKMVQAYFDKSGQKLNENSFEYKVIEAAASELYSLSCYGDFILKQAFVQSAGGEYLDRHGYMRMCERKTGRKASGVLTFSVSEAQDDDIVIEENTICSKLSNPLISYKTLNSATISAGQTSVDVSVEALETGDKYNALPNEVAVLVNAPAKVERVANNNEIKGGTDDESDSAFRKRIIENFKLPLNGYNVKSIESIVKNQEEYDDCVVLPSENGGNITVVVATNHDIDDMDIYTISRLIPQIQLFGIYLTVEQAKKSDFNLKAKVYVDTIFDKEKQKEEIYNALFEILDRKKIGKTVILDDLKKAVFKIDGVNDISIQSDKLLNDNVIVCGAKEYLNLTELEVELYVG